jgi:nucleoside 2-deoxyribosyltransferase
MPAGKSGHLELGYFVGRGKPAFILFDEVPTRFDVMHQFATEVWTSNQEMIERLQNYAV